MKARIVGEGNKTGMNRGQKRKMLKRLGLPMTMMGIFDRSADIVIDQLVDDTVVELDYDRIMENDDKSEMYVKFVEEWKDKEVHVYQDEEHKGSQLYCLREDEGEIPWLFDLSELKIIEIPGGMTMGEDERSEDSTIEVMGEDSGEVMGENMSEDTGEVELNMTLQEID